MCWQAAQTNYCHGKAPRTMLERCMGGERFVPQHIAAPARNRSPDDVRQRAGGHNSPHCQNRSEQTDDGCVSSFSSFIKKKQGTRMRNTQKKMLNKYIALSACRCCQELYSGSTTAAEEMQRTNGSARTQAVWQKRQMVPLFLWLFRKVCDA